MTVFFVAVVCGVGFGFYTKFGHLPIPSHQPVLLYHTAPHWSGQRLTASSDHI